jgi:hypothetical protein
MVRMVLGDTENPCFQERDFADLSEAIRETEPRLGEVWNHAAAYDDQGNSICEIVP